MNLKRILVVLTLLLTPLFIGGGVYVIQSRSLPEPPDRHWQLLREKVAFQINHFPGTAGIYIKDLRNGWVIESNPETLFPSASLVKIPMMAAVYQANLSGRISLDESLPLQRRLKTRGSGTLKFEKSGKRFTVRQLVYKMITESDNTAANMLTDLLGLDYFNRSFHDLGLARTNFSRTIMDLRLRDRGVENYTTPQDMARMLELIYAKKLTGAEEMIEILKGQKINDRLPVAIPDDWEIGHKTGLMRDTCHDVGIVFAPTSDYLICVLTKDIHNYRRAKAFISEVSHLAASYYADPSLHPAPRRSFWSSFLEGTSLPGRAG